MPHNGNYNVQGKENVRCSLSVSTLRTTWRPSVVRKIALDNRNVSAKGMPNTFLECFQSRAFPDFKPLFGKEGRTLAPNGVGHYLHQLLLAKNQKGTMSERLLICLYCSETRSTERSRTSASSLTSLCFPCLVLGYKRWWSGEPESGRFSKANQKKSRCNLSCSRTFWRTLTRRKVRKA